MSLWLLILLIIIIIFLIFLVGIQLFDYYYNSNFTNLQITDWSKDYLSFDQNNFKNLSKKKRWEVRFKVFEHYDRIKDQYKSLNTIKKFYYPINQNSKIFVSIASYRDPECHKTINSLITNCHNKENLRILVCEQNEDSDISCLVDNEKYSHLIEIIKLPALLAKGPTFARFLIQQNYNNEEFYLQIDSHTQFEKNWDKKLIDSLNKLPEKSCITQYLPEYNIKSKNIKNYSVRSGLSVNLINELDDFYRVQSFFVTDIDKSVDVNEANAWSGCFSFSRGNICIDAPIDPLTPELFFGEEMDIALRLFTRGWSFYSPNYPVAYTSFDRTYRNTFWFKKSYDKVLTLLSRFRVHYRIGTLPKYYKKIIKEKYPMLINQIDDYLLGDIKSLQDYEDLIGFDIIPNY